MAKKSRRICDNCKLSFPEYHLVDGFKIDQKNWCRDCRVGKNHVPNKCNCDARGCYCLVGFPYELLCIRCRDDRYPGDVHVFCVCPPSEDVFDEWIFKK